LELLPHPENQIAVRVADLERRGWPDIMVWNPLRSASGKWEACGEGWDIVEDDPGTFCARLEAKLAAR
jgi:hypothetical protein